MLRALLLAALLALAACGGKHLTLGGAPKFGSAAEDDYAAGSDLLKDGSYPEAQKFFEHVKTKYPFSKYAALSDLRLADAKFDQKLWTEAIAAYEEFIRLHPTHEDVDYAQFRIALAHYEDGPSDFALFPPSYEKDQRQLEQAAEGFRSFLQKFPESKYAAEAKKRLEQADGRLADHEWYVADFYFKRDKWPGAASRYEALVDKYPGSRHEPEALLRLAEACVKMDEKHRARTALQKLIVSHPQDPRRPEAEKLLAKLR
ncbi:MAG TPA: outer membrane protein assembly factor BamD [Anaeromyxobacter sp.]